MYTLSTGDHPEASRRPGRGAVQHAAQPQPVVAAGVAIARRRHEQRRLVGLQQLYGTVDQPGRHDRQRSVGRRLVASLPGVYVLTGGVDSLLKRARATYHARVRVCVSRE